jgi:hypothetical protein
MPNNPSSYANTADMYPDSGIYGRILPSGYAHFADSLQEQINKNGLSYITTFPSGWDENHDRKKEYYGSLQEVFVRDIQSKVLCVSFPIYTSGINGSGSHAAYTASPGGIDHSTMSNIFG